MTIIPSLQKKVDKIVADAGLGAGASTSLDDMAYLSVSDRACFWEYLGELCALFGIRGLDRHERELSALACVIIWKVYIPCLKRWRERHSTGDAVRKVERRLERRTVANILRKVGMEDQAQSYERCGEHIYNMECCRCGHVHKVNYHCKLRVCPECKRAREWEVVESCKDALLSLGKLRKFELTIKNVSDLDAGVKKIRACFKKLRLSDKRQAEKWGFACKSGYKTLIRGGLSGIETPLGNDGLWNVHLHCVYAGGYIKQGWLADDWERVTGDSRVVYIKEVKDAERDIGYVAKYACKQSGALLEDGDKLGEYVKVLYKVRLVQPFGSLLGKKIKRGAFRCPKCGCYIWRVYDARTGVLVYDGMMGLHERASPSEWLSLYPRGIIG